MQYKLFFHVVKLLLVLFIAILFPARLNIEGNQSLILLNVRFAMLKIIFGGVHGLIIENHGDIPFSKPEDIGHETSALMAVITEKVRERFGVPLGINVLANAAIPAMAALAGGADFVRVNQWANAYIANEGFIEGAAAKALRYRSMLRAEHIRVFADSHVKHGSHAIVADRSIQELTRDVDFFEADAVIATGQRTGDSATMAEIDEIRAATELPLLVGSGVTPANVSQILGRTQGSLWPAP
jgi:membrane complex biogenesis BtpA family protein